MPTTLEVTCPVEGCDAGPDGGPWRGSAAAAGEHALTHQNAELALELPDFDPGHSGQTFAESADLAEAADLTDDEEVELEDESVQEEEIPPAPGADATRNDLEIWLGEYGRFDENGDPSDDETAQTVARLDVELQIHEELEKTEAAIAGVQAATAETPEPWEVAISRTIREANTAAKYRWAVVDFGPEPPELLETFSNRPDADEYAVERAIEGEDAVQRIADVHLVADDWQIQQELATPILETVAGDNVGRTDKLFDPSAYDREDLQIPKIDGQAIDRIGIGFGGSIMLDRSEPKDVALYNRLHGQNGIELWVEGVWGGTAAKPATNKGGDLDVIVAQKTIRIDSIRVIDAEVLGQIEGLELVREAVRRVARSGVTHDEIENAVTVELENL